MKRNPQLLSAIIEQPDADQPRRVYADWLLEQADPRGEYISAVLNLRGRVDPVTRKLSRARAADLSRAHGATWSQALTELGATVVRFSGGFVQEVALPEAALAKLPNLLGLEPITHLQVTLADGAGLLAAMQSPAFRSIRHLKLSGALDPWAEGLAELADDEVATLRTDSLEAIVLASMMDEATTVETLALSTLFPALRRLSLTGMMEEGSEAGDAAFAALGKGRLKLSTLYASRCGVTDEGVAALVNGKGATTLELLALGGNGLTDEAMSAMVESTKLKKLVRLELPFNELTDEGLAPLADRSVLPTLKSLDIRGMFLEELDGLQARFGERLGR